MMTSNNKKKEKWKKCVKGPLNEISPLNTFLQVLQTHTHQILQKLLFSCKPQC